jgi:DNA repair protein RadC
MTPLEGHRERLRQRFRENQQLLTETEQLELLLTYAISRRDVAPLARDLMARFGSLRAVIAAPPEQLLEIAGVGESTVTFFQLFESIMAESSEGSSDMSPAKQNAPSPQLNLFELEPKIEKSSSSSYPAKKKPAIKERQMRVFANDEIANSLAFLPQADNFQSLEEFKSYLYEKLPYNAAETRQRRARNIIERLYQEGSIDTPLTYYAARCTSQADLQPVVFYHVLKAEPIAAKIAEELIWPALPLGRVEREQVNEFILRYLPDVKSASLEKMYESMSHTYALTGVGVVDKKGFRFQLRQGSLESLLYILTSEFHEPGIYSFDNLYGSPLHHWLLWDREWIRLQLYNLQDFGILTKVSEIDTVRQFTLAVDQPKALRLFFDHPERNRKAIREQAESQASDQEK